MGARGIVTYRFLRKGCLSEVRYGEVRGAFDQACEDLESEDAMPIEIVTDDQILFSSFDLYTLCDLYYDWKAGKGGHPLGQGAKAS